MTPIEEMKIKFNKSFEMADLLSGIESESTTKGYKSYWNLDTIPPEVFLHICSFLNAKFLVDTLGKVCRRFKDIIEKESTWKARVFKKYPKVYPVVPGTVTDWMEACIEREEQHRLWKSMKIFSLGVPLMKRHDLNDAHFGSVNVIDLLQNARLCASGGRDGALKLWNMSDLKALWNEQDYKDCLVVGNLGAHTSAWVWSLAHDDQMNRLYSGGFDSHMRIWDIEESLTCVTSYSLPSPVLCLTTSDHCICSGCYGRSVSLFDPRSGGVKPQIQHIRHSKAVLCIAADDTRIISGSEDGTLIEYDKVAGKVQRTIQLKSYPLSMSYGHGQLFVGDVQGSFHIIDPKQFKVLQSYPSGHSAKVTGIQHSLGIVATCSTDQYIRILEPTLDPEPIAVLRTSGQVSKISLCNSILASGNTDDSISIWIPMEDCEMFN